jgi:hypothetical protein
MREEHLADEFPAAPDPGLAEDALQMLLNGKPQARVLETARAP